MAAGLPVAASPVGVLSRMVRPGETGFAPGDNGAGAEALSSLLADRAGAAAMGARGRALVEREWSFEAHESGLVEALRGNGSPGRSDLPK